MMVDKGGYTFKEITLLDESLTDCKLKVAKKMIKKKKKKTS